LNATLLAVRARAHPAYDRENGQSATSGASAITVGAAALLLQMNPALKAKRTGGQIRTILHNTAVSDVFTGHVPNSTWGLGKLNMLAAADIVAAMIRANPVLLRTSITFPAQKVGTLSAPASVIRMT
jgi:hypothetical protein